MSINILKSTTQSEDLCINSPWWCNSDKTEYE